MKIAVFTDKSGNVLPFYTGGTVELYVDEKNTWICIKKIPFEIQDDLTMEEVRKRILFIVDEIEDCPILVVDTIKGFPRSLLEDRGISIWNYKGVLLLQLFDHIKKQMEKIKEEKTALIPVPVAKEGVSDGIYEINLAKVLESDSSLTSKMVLLPFFQNNVFKKLEIVCKHVPKWFDNEFGVLKLDVRTEESADGLCHAVVFPRTTMKNSGEKNDTRKSLNNTCESNTCKSSDNIRETSNIIRESFNVNGKIPDIIRMNSNEVSINSIEVKNTLLAKHPCFDIKARHTHARVHLPVAPKCNIQCNYCNRQYDCVNESRPGVTSAVLSPYQAVEYLKELDKHIDNLSVIGIAGPGDPFANPEETLQTMRLVKEVFPDRIFCLSTNGLNLRPYINEIAELGVTHVTITINAVDPEIGAKIYSWIRYEKHIYRDVAAAEIILRRQLKCIPLLKEKGITVKINTVILPGINDHHIEKIAQKVAELGADVMNCIPLVPNKDTVFKTMQKPPADMVKLVREQSKKYIGMMTHCARCRADAAGLLGQDFSGAIGLLQEFALRPAVPTKDRPYTAIATYEGMLVNAHLGDADSLYIYRQTPNGFQYVEERATPEAGCGDQRWYNIATLLKDCRALLASGVGPNPLKILQGSGLRVIQMTGLIDDGLEAVYNGKFIKTVQEPAAFRCGEGCGGNARGCA